MSSHLMVDLSTVICEIRKMVLPWEISRTLHDDGTRRGVIFRIDASVHDYGVVPRKQARRLLHILLSGNTSVWSHVTDFASSSFTPFHFPVETWMYHGSHDTCWREVVESLLSEQHRSMCEMVNPDVAPAKLWQHNHFGFGDPWFFVDVAYKDDKLMGITRTKLRN